MACSREHLEPGRFGDQIYAAVDAGEIDADTAATLVRTFLGGGVDTTVLALGLADRCSATNPAAVGEAVRAARPGACPRSTRRCA
jgi:hypothetical protein